MNEIQNPRTFVSKSASTFFARWWKFTFFLHWKVTRSKYVCEYSIHFNETSCEKKHECLWMTWMSRNMWKAFPSIYFVYLKFADASFGAVAILEKVACFISEWFFTVPFCCAGNIMSLNFSRFLTCLQFKLTFWSSRHLTYLFLFLQTYYQVFLSHIYF